MLEEFKKFALKGNVVDMAIGIIIGTAFGKIVSSLVNDIIMPPIGKLIGGMDFSNLYINLGNGKFENLQAAQEAGAATINYGIFINSILDFLIIAFSLFIVIRQMNRFKRKEVEKTPETPKNEVLLTEIRDLLKKNVKTTKSKK